MTPKDLGLKIATPKKKIIPYITVHIVGDYNDADYIETHERWILNPKYKEDIATYKKAIKFLRKNYETIFKDYFIREPEPEDEDIREEFSDYFNVPFCVDDQCHTIEEIEMTYTDEKGVTYKLELLKEVDPFEDDYEDDWDDDDE